MIILMVIRFSVMYLIKIVNTCLIIQTYPALLTYPGLGGIKKQGDFLILIIYYSLYFVRKHMHHKINII